MRSETDEGFEAALDADLGWRRIELTALQSTLEKARSLNPESPATRGLSRAMATMSYAHWEGFSKNSLERYMKLISRRKPPLSNTADGLALEHLDRMWKRVNSGDQEARESILSILRGGGDQRLRVERSRLADTGGNLRYEKLTDLFARGSLPLGSFETKANLIDLKICDRRNEVAHGRDLHCDVDESLDVCSNVIELMENMRDVLVGQVRSHGYLAK